MPSIPYSRYIIGRIPWYSFLIVTGAAIAILLAYREEKRLSLPSDTVIDLSLRVIPLGIIGARIYYVIFSWSSFRDDPISVLYIWNGGLAIYGGIIAGILTLIVFAKKRNLSPFLLFDIIVPGLSLAQSIGRWGNYFNMEAYGQIISIPGLCFFPFAVRIFESGGWNWHMATFFYESVLDLIIFIFLFCARKHYFRNTGDPFLHYLFLYASGRLCIEQFRSDSLFSLSGGTRISQILSEMIVIAVLIHYKMFTDNKTCRHKPLRTVSFICSVCITFITLLVSSGLFPGLFDTTSKQVFILLLTSAVNISVLFILYNTCLAKERTYADD